MIHPSGHSLPKRRRGFVLITSALCGLMLMGAAGIALDLGRMYVVRSEAQSYVDAAALNGVVYLDGTSAGLTGGRAERARHGGPLPLPLAELRRHNRTVQPATQWAVR